MKKICISLLMSVPLVSLAQNPVIRDQFSADPTARVFNNKVYLYPSHDIMPPAGQRQDWFCMEDYHVFSSENLTDWTDHGVIVTQNKVPWVRPNSYSMWAPDCVYRNGKYYFYFPSAPAEGRDLDLVSALPLPTIPRGHSFLSQSLSRASAVSTPVCYRLRMVMLTSSGELDVAPNLSPT